MRGLEEHELISSLKELIDFENDLENLKQTLASRFDFTLNDCFQLFDFSNSGFITLTDLQEAFEAYGVFPSREEASLILNRFDNDDDGRLRYSEFQEMFNPKEVRCSDLLLNRESQNFDIYYPKGEYFAGAT